jgi:hypothetical protein
MALSRGVVRRALKYAVVVGVLLIAINHGNAILKGDVSLTRVFQMILTVFVPYSVSTSSSVAALREIDGEKR